MNDSTSIIQSEPDPENPGWVTYVAGQAEGYNRSVMGKFIVRAESANTARLRMYLSERHLNAMKTVHGGALMGIADVALFATCFKLLAFDPSYSVTIDLQCQFLAGSLPSDSIDAVTEVLRETRRMVFLRGLMVQGDHRVAAFSGTLRK